MLVKENQAARGGSGYASSNPVQATFASQTMRYSGFILLAFIVFHLAHYTVRNVHPEFAHLETELEGVGTMHHVYDKLLPLAKAEGLEQPIVHDIFSMVAIGFSAQFWYVSVFYLIAMGLLCMHLSHGISSLFQSLGWRNAVWRTRLDAIARLTSAVVFFGFASVPAAGLFDLYPHQDAVDWEQFEALGESMGSRVVEVSVDSEEGEPIQ